MYAVKWAHDVTGLPDPTVHSLVRNLLAGKRLGGKQVKKKHAVQSSAIVQLCEKFKDSTCLSVLRDLAMITVCFAGFLRYSELSNLKCKDVVFHQDHVSLLISKGKTDQYRKGNEVVLSRGLTLGCPVKRLECYMAAACISKVSDDYLFKAVCKSKGKQFLIHKRRPLSYTRARECLVQKLRLVCGKDVNLGLHSLRAGGTTCAANQNVNERLIKRHGRWKGDLSKDGYIDDSLDKRLQVSRSFNL